MKSDTGLTFEKVDDEFPFRNFLTFRLSRVQAKLNAQASLILKQHCGLNLTQWRIVLLLGSVSATTAGSLTAATGIDKGLFSRKLKTLIEMGVVKIKTNRDDHRQQLISLTPKGMRLYDKMAPVMRTRQQYLLSVLTAKERDIVAASLRKLEAAANITEFVQVENV